MTNEHVLRHILRSSGVQEFRSSGVQEFRSSGVQAVEEYRIARRKRAVTLWYESNLALSIVAS
jgi:hypothetical protein